MLPGDKFTIIKTFKASKSDRIMDSIFFLKKKQSVKRFCSRIRFDGFISLLILCLLNITCISFSFVSHHLEMNPYQEG